MTAPIFQALWHPAGSTARHDAMSLIVRPLTRSDQAQWRRLWRDYLAFYQTEVPETDYATYFERLLGDDPQDYHGVIAELDGRPVGRAPIQAVYEAADAAGAPSVYWLTQDFNTEARKLYDRIGTLTPFIKYARLV